MQAQAEFGGGCSKPFVERPEPELGQANRRKQVHVDPTEATSHQLLRLDESQHFIVSRAGLRHPLHSQGGALESP